MKCKDCPAFWNTEDDSGCFINKLEQKKNGEDKQGCKLGIKRIEKTIKDFEKQKDDFYSGFINYLKGVNNNGENK